MQFSLHLLPVRPIYGVYQRSLDGESPVAHLDDSLLPAHSLVVETKDLLRTEEGLPAALLDHLSGQPPDSAQQRDAPLALSKATAKERRHTNKNNRSQLTHRIGNLQWRSQNCFRYMPMWSNERTCLCCTSKGKQYVCLGNHKLQRSGNTDCRTRYASLLDEAVQ